MGEIPLPLEEGLEVAAVQVVLLPSPAGLPDTLTYRVPDRLRAAVPVGTPVLVPLGGREHLGYVVERITLPASAETRRLRPVRTVARGEPAFDDSLLALLRWVAQEYRCSLAEALPLSVPERHGVELQDTVALGAWDGSVPAGIGALTRAALEQVYRTLSEAGGSLPRAELEAAVRVPTLRPALRRAAQEGWVRESQSLLPPKMRPRRLKAVRLAPGAPGVALGAKQRLVVEHLAAGTPGEPAPQRDLCAALGVTPAVVAGLVRKGVLEACEVEVRRVPRGYGEGRDAAPPLTPFQGAAADGIAAAMRRAEGETLLLFGVTGSGKTEVYLNAIERARAAQRTAILLVPEISLTAQVAAVVRRRLGEGVAILHSALSDGERFDEWERVRRGDADVVVGPRSALFAPLRDPALVVLDEEHDGSYKQDRSPRYHAREAARMRARLSGGCALLGSATPSVESFHAALTGRYALLELPERVRQRPLPAVEIADLRREAKGGAVFGRRLEDAIRQRLAEGEQTILFLNRRGYSSFLLCRDCGHVPRCPRCDVSLTLHRLRAGALLCHHCGHSRRAPATCERCGGARVRQFGIGTQRVEDAVRERFPGARVARLDRDAASGRGAHTRIVQAVANREVDILIGTQMVTKGFDFPGVTLVGVVTADIALNVPDFRAGERAFQLLTQVSGRAGRGDRPGEVVVQTFSPDHPSIQAASRHDYRGFYSGEIRQREELGYPPFGALARLVSAHPEDAAAQNRIEAAAEVLSPVARASGVELRGPAPCPLARLHDRYRWHLLLKAPDRAALRAALDAGWPSVQRRVGGVSVDVEPVDLQ